MRIASPDHVTDEVREGFLCDGFLAVDRLVGPEVVETLRDAYDDILSGRVRARGDRQLGGIIRQVKHPAKDSPAFAANPALDAGTALARSLFRRDDLTKVYEMLIDKPAGTEHETPWHQDVGYFGKPVAPAGHPTGVQDVQLWLALDPVDEGNGCMQFVRRAHGEPSLAHRVVSGDPEDEGRLIALDDDLDTSSAVACPLEPGGCTVHLVGTPHFTGANRSADRPRRAYIFNIGPPKLAAVSEESLRAGWGESARL